MKLGELKPSSGAQKSPKRLGRGEGSGKGKTSGRGNKRYHSRSGSKRRSWYEGGQMPLQRRVPKRGFSNARFKITHQIVSIAGIDKLGEKKVDVLTMWERGLIQTVVAPVKVLANGEISSAVEVTAHAFSKGAAEKIEKAGGKTIIV